MERELVFFLSLTILLFLLVFAHQKSNYHALDLKYNSIDGRKSKYYLFHENVEEFSSACKLKQTL